MINIIISHLKEDILLLKDRRSFLLWVIMLYNILFASYIFISNYDAVFKNNIPIYYNSYQNIDVEIVNDKINGKLNNYITINYFSNVCYEKNCSLLNEGKYFISKIEFIKIGEKYFLHYFCLDSLNEKCVYNISPEFIENEKNNLIDKAKDDIKWTWIILLIGMLIIFFELETRKFRIRNGFI